MGSAMKIVRGKLAASAPTSPSRPRSRRGAQIGCTWLGDPELPSALRFRFPAPSTGYGHSTQGVHDHHNYQDQSDYTEASAAAPSRISVIAAAAAEQKH